MWGRIAKLTFFLLFTNILRSSMVSAEKLKTEIKENSNYRKLPTTREADPSGGNGVNKADWNFIASIAYGRYIFQYGAAIKPTVVVTSWSAEFFQECVAEGLKCFGKMGVRIGAENMAKLNSESIAITNHVNCKYMFAEVAAIPENDTIHLVDKIAFHPKWEFVPVPQFDKVYMNSIVLLYLKASISEAKLIPISKAARVPGTTCKIASWEAPNTNKTYQPNLAEIDLKILSDKEISAAWSKRHNNLTQGVINKMLKSKFVAKGTMAINVPGCVLVCNKMIQGILEDVMGDNEYSFEDAYYHDSWMKETHSEAISPEEFRTSTTEENVDDEDAVTEHAAGGKTRLQESQVTIIILISFHLL